MNTIGIVAEFNPFHEGHAYLFRKAKELTGAGRICCVMSGNFVQRGTPAVFDKWERAEAAIRGGADLILELPAIFSCASSREFARGAVNILSGLGTVDVLACGSEAGDAALLKQAARLARTAEDSPSLKEYLQQGLSFPAARQKVLDDLCQDADPQLDPQLYKQPNNILALSYLQALEDPLIVPEEGKPAFFTLKRGDDGHHVTASRLRAALAADPSTGKRLQDIESRFFDLLRYTVLRSAPEELEEIASAGEGLGYLLKKEIRRATSLTDLKKRLKSRRYTETRLDRLFVQTLLGIRRADLAGASAYLRPLAFNDAGAALLRESKAGGKARLPFVEDVAGSLRAQDRVQAGPAGEALRRTLEIEVLAGDLYALLSGDSLYAASDYVRKPRPVRP